MTKLFSCHRLLRFHTKSFAPLCSEAVHSSRIEVLYDASISYFSAYTHIRSCKVDCVLAVGVWARVGQTWKHIPIFLVSEKASPQPLSLRAI